LRRLRAAVAAVDGCQDNTLLLPEALTRSLVLLVLPPAGTGFSSEAARISHVSLCF
jgi:hypothetical protein